MEPTECDCCGYKADKLHLSNFNCEVRAGRTSRKYSLCDVCYHTHLSDALLFPSRSFDSDLYKSIAWVANWLRDEIRSAGKPQSP